MSSFLTFAIVALLIFAGYEYYQHTQEAAAFIQQRDSLKSSIAQMQKSNADLKASQSALNDKLSALQNQQQQNQTPAAPAAPAASGAPAAPATPAPAPSQ